MDYIFSTKQKKLIAISKNKGHLLMADAKRIYSTRRACLNAIDRLLKAEIIFEGYGKYEYNKDADIIVTAYLGINGD